MLSGGLQLNTQMYLLMVIFDYDRTRLMTRIKAQEYVQKHKTMIAYLSETVLFTEQIETHHKNTDIRFLLVNVYVFWMFVILPHICMFLYSETKQC
jgi:hypothetical protein